MALIRPVVLVYQEVASPAVTPVTPDLNCLVVGPAYHIQDYYDPGTTDYADKEDILLGTEYGELEAAVGTAVPVGADYITVADPPNNEVGAVLDGDSVVVFFDDATVIIDSGTVGTTVALDPNTFVAAGGDATTFNTVGTGRVIAGDRLIITDGTVDLQRTVLEVVDDATLLLTEDWPTVGWTHAATQGWRIERALQDQEIDASFFSVNGNSISIDGGVTLTVTNQGAKVVSYAKVYIEYRSLRQDLTDLDTVETTDDIEANIGRLDARNPLAVGVFVALQNTTSMVQFVGVLTDDLAGHTEVSDAIATRTDVYAIVPLSTDVLVHAMWNTDCVGLALPDETNGRPQKFRVVLGCGTLPTTKDIVEPLATGLAETVTGTAPAGIVRITLTGVASLVTGGVIPGDILTVTVTSAAGVVALGSYTIASVASAAIVEVEAAAPFASAGNADITCQIFQSDGVTSRIASAPLVGTITAAGDDLYLQLRDANGTFVSSGVAAGDIVQMPADFSADFTGDLVSLVVASVQSENRLRLVNNGADTATTQNELPHGVIRAGSALAPTTAILNYRVVRTLSKSGQVTELVAVAQSFDSRRTVLVWPDRVDVGGVTDGDAQPGYYLACAVGGMTAGLPPHQGFTFLGIAGIRRIYRANTYFTEAQLTDLSQGGWYVFAQATPTSLPYTIHQLTTDPTTLASGEFSVVKNFDFVSLFFVDILDDFLGQYNVTEETLTLIRAALNIGGDTLRLRTYAKIGAPLTSFSILDLLVSPVSADRINAHLSVGLPKPLNNIELHLVA
jgi:hypothetical protein